MRGQRTYATPPRRKPPSYCGQFTVQQCRETGVVSYRRFRCNTYHCPRCCKRRLREVRDRAIRLCVRNDLRRFATLTLPGRWHLSGGQRRGELGTRLTIREVRRLWAALRSALWRKYGTGRVLYFAVIEPHRDGTAHLHVAFSFNVRRQDIEAAWRRCGGGFAKIKPKTPREIGAYLTPYITKQAWVDLPAGVRRFTVSHPLALWGTAKRRCWARLLAMTPERVLGYLDRLGAEPAGAKFERLPEGMGPPELLEFIAEPCEVRIREVTSADFCETSRRRWARAAALARYRFSGPLAALPAGNVADGWLDRREAAHA